MRQTSAGARVGQKERKGARKNKGKGGLVWETTRGGGYFSGGWLVCLGVLHSQGSRLQVARGMTRHHKKTLACVVRARNAGNNPTDTLLRLEARVSDTVQYLPPTGSGSVRGEKHEETDRGRADKGGTHLRISIYSTGAYYKLGSCQKTATYVDMSSAVSVGAPPP